MVVLIIVCVIIVAVVVGLVILMALLVPAVAKVREAAERVNTENNMKMCAIGLHNYVSTYKRFPNASGSGGIYTGTNERSMWFQLLPYIEADNVYKNNIHDAVIAPYLSPADKYVTRKEGKLNLAANIRVFGFAALGVEANNAVAPGTGQARGNRLAGFWRRR
jgi:hypothetical protein